MKSFFKNPKVIQWLLVLLALGAVVAAKFNQVDQRLLRVFSSLNDIVYPLELAAHSLEREAVEGWDRVINLYQAQEENTALKEEIQALRVRMLDYEHQRTEVQRLRRILGFAADAGNEHLVAEIVNSGQNLMFPSLRINRGSRAGVKIGMPVISSQGAVGKVIRVGFHHADVQTLHDVNFRLDVILQRTRQRSLLTGVGQGRCQIQLHRRSEIKIGDAIVSSGIVGAFPKGLPVGRVVRILHTNEDVSQVLSVEPWVEFEKLEEVVILLSSDQGLDKLSKTAGQDWMEHFDRL